MPLATYGRVAPWQKFKRVGDCPICEGGDAMKRQRGARCAGFLSSDGRYAFCQREEYAGGLPLRQTQPPTYMHKLDGPCHCGEDHVAAYHLEPLPQRKATSIPTPPTRSHLTYTPTAIYDYGAGLRFLRYQQGKEKKRFIWQHADGEGGWLDGRDDRHPGLYRAEQIAEADTRKLVFWPEGEKCVDALRALGAVATCNPDGAGCFHKVAEVAQEALEGRHVVILSDADGTGREHAVQVAEGLLAVAASVRVLELEGAHDVADWLAAGHELTELLEIVAVTPVKSIIDFTATSDEVKRLKADNATCHAQVQSMNEKLLWIFDTLATPEEIMPISKRVTLIIARRNAEWRVVDPESPEEQEVAEAGFTPDYYEAIGKAGGMSDGTAGKNLRSLAEDYGLVHIETFHEIKDGISLPRISYSIEPTKISDHQVWMPKDGPRKKRGGTRPGAGRKKVCQTPGCGGEEFTPERTYREVVDCFVQESACKKCGAIHRETVSEQVIGRELAPSEINDRFHETPDKWSDASDSESNDTPPPLYTDASNIALTPECHGTGAAHVYAMMRDARGRRVCIACETPEERWEA